MKYSKIEAIDALLVCVPQRVNSKRTSCPNECDGNKRQCEGGFRPDEDSALHVHQHYRFRLTVFERGGS